MKYTPGTSLVLLAIAAGTGCLVRAEQVKLRIRANIDGPSTLRIKDNKIWWETYGHTAAPGLYRCRGSDPEGCTGDPFLTKCTMEGDGRTCHRPTILSGGWGRLEWYPVWPYKSGDDDRTNYGGYVSQALDLANVGVHLGRAPSLIKSRITPDPEAVPRRDCSETCDGWGYGWPVNNWVGDCCNVNAKESGMTEVNIHDHWVGSADYDIVLKFEPSAGGDDDDDDRAECKACRKACSKKNKKVTPKRKKWIKIKVCKMKCKKRFGNKACKG